MMMMMDIFTFFIFTLTLGGLVSGVVAYLKLDSKQISSLESTVVELQKSGITVARKEPEPYQAYGWMQEEEIDEKPQKSTVLTFPPTSWPVPSKRTERQEIRQWSVRQKANQLTTEINNKAMYVGGSDKQNFGYGGSHAIMDKQLPHTRVT